MLSRDLCALGVAVLCGVAAPRAEAQVAGIRIPPGFVVAEFAGDDLAHDIYTMTIDARGRVFVAGRGYIKRLIDDNGDGRADRAIEVAREPKDGAHGLLVDADMLFAVGDGAIRRLRLGSDGRALGPSEKLVAVKTGGEHTAHAIRRGPDGWLYLICGDGTGIVRPSRAPTGLPVGGFVQRFSPDFATMEIVADGFRNPYDFDFTADGEPITFDSDNERCIGLPWYEGCRLYHVKSGGHYGWRAPQHAVTWRMPPYFLDVVAPLADLGRGSPTGVACYRHRQFPERYRGGVFLADWTFGRVWFAPLSVRGGTYSTRPEPFLESTGDLGLAPTALAVHPLNGDLYMAIGGRGTRGGVFRISYAAGERTGYETTTLAAKERRTEPGRRWDDSLPAAEDLRRLSPEALLGVVRRAQRVVGDIGDPGLRGTAFEGYSSRPGGSMLPADWLAALRDLVRRGDAVLAREGFRLLAMVGDAHDEAAELAAGQFSERLSPVDDIHFLIVLARLPGRRSEFATSQTAAVLLDLDRRFTAAGLARDRNWPLRIAEIHAELSRKDPHLNRTIVERPGFAQPGNAILTRVPGFDRKRAAERFLDHARQNATFTWNADVIALLDAVPVAVRRPWLDTLWDRGGFEDALLLIMALDPLETDRAKFAGGLRSPQHRVAEACLTALGRLPASAAADDLWPVLRALRSIDDSKANVKVRERLIGLLQRASGESFGPDRAAWSAWFARVHPDAASKRDGIDSAGWRKRFAAIDWSLGESVRGKVVFDRASCAACHTGASALGPSLAGSVARLSRDDLLTAIVEPDRDIAPAYRSVLITMRDGKVHQGLIVYDASDGVMLQTGATTTVRIAGDAIESRATTEHSLMPSGLLDKLSDRDIADLIAYVRSVK